MAAAESKQQALKGLEATPEGQVRQGAMTHSVTHSATHSVSLICWCKLEPQEEIMIHDNP